MKLHLDKIHNIQLQTWDDKAEIYFMLKQYKGVKFVLGFEKEEVKSYGWEACKVESDGIDCKLTERQKDNCKKYMDQHIYALKDYFLNTCEETKMPLMLIAG